MILKSLNFEPSHLSNIESWHGHTFFVRDLIEWNRPNLIVELGVHKGDSLLSIAQSCKDVGYTPNIVGIDHWRGDLHAGPVNMSNFGRVERIRNKYYSDSVTLLVRSFEDALNDFDNDSIDLIHLDGLHTYEAARQDFLNWIPKLKKDGIMLIHDTKSLDKNFGVAQLWNEVRKVYKHAEFEHSQGLAVLLGIDFKSKNNWERHILTQETLNILNSYYSLLSAKLRLMRMARKSKNPFDQQQWRAGAEGIHKAAKYLSRAISIPYWLRKYFKII